MSLLKSLMAARSEQSGRLVNMAVQRLGEDDRKIIYWAFSGKDFGELAGSLSVDRKEINQRFRRALSNLRQLLNAMEKETPI